MEWFGSWQGHMADLSLWLVVIMASGLSGTLIGYERERKDKPAGLKTIALICMGSAIFTRLSFVLADADADVTRIAAQVIPGVGFLGAGAILRNRGAVIGLTTAASIWVAAALGMVIGGSYVALGLLLTLLVLGVQFLASRMEVLAIGRCQAEQLTVVYESRGGRTLVRLLRLLDEERVKDEPVVDESDPEQGRITFSLCTNHRHHRRILSQLADMPTVQRLEGASLTERRRR